MWFVQIVLLICVMVGCGYRPIQRVNQSSVWQARRVAVGRFENLSQQPGMELMVATQVEATLRERQVALVLNHESTGVITGRVTRLAQSNLAATALSYGMRMDMQLLDRETKTVIWRQTSYPCNQSADAGFDYALRLDEKVLFLKALVKTCVEQLLDNLTSTLIERSHSPSNPMQ